jgi:hypothetical protein
MLLERERDLERRGFGAVSRAVGRHVYLMEYTATRVASEATLPK